MVNRQKRNKQTPTEPQAEVAQLLARASQLMGGPPTGNTIAAPVLPKRQAFQPTDTQWKCTHCQKPNWTPRIQCRFCGLKKNAGRGHQSRCCLRSGSGGKGCSSSHRGCQQPGGQHRQRAFQIYRLRNRHRAGTQLGAYPNGNYCSWRRHGRFARAKQRPHASGPARLQRSGRPTARRKSSQASSGTGQTGAGPQCSQSATPRGRGRAVAQQQAFFWCWWIHQLLSIVIAG